MKPILTLFSVVLFQISFAQSPDFSWLEGTWRGPGFGGSFEEIWSAPNANGSVMGMFRFTDENGDVQFLEFWVLDASGMKLKHFDPEFVGWEEKDDFVNFEMIKSEPNKVTMKGLIYERTPENTLKIALDMQQDDGKLTTERFELQREE